MYGCGFAIIERNGRGYAEKLVPVHYHDVDIKEINGERFYSVRDYGVVMPENMLEICNMLRMSPIRLHRENMGLAKAAQDFGSEYFGQKGQMTGVLASDQPLRKEQMDVIQNSWNQSAMNAGTKLLPFGFKYQRITGRGDLPHLQRATIIGAAAITNHVQQRRAAEPTIRTSHDRAVDQAHRARNRPQTYPVIRTS
jgi:hypothetical protein